MKRRDVIKGLSLGLPALALSSRISFAEATSVSANLKTLNLIVEGPFVCLLQDGQAEIFAPSVDRHLYQIDHTAAQKGTYYLKGVRGVSDARSIKYVTPAGAEAFRLSLEQLHLSLNRDKAPYFSFVVPLPKQIVAVVSRKAEIVDAFEQPRNVMMPTTYAFVYDVTDATQVRLDGDDEWNPEKRRAEDGVVNLSVAAGLPIGVQDPALEHFRMAFAEVNRYLPGLKLQILRVGAERKTAELPGYPGIEPRGGDVECMLPPILIPPPKPPSTVAKSE